MRREPASPCSGPRQVCIGVAAGSVIEPMSSIDAGHPREELRRSAALRTTPPRGSERTQRSSSHRAHRNPHSHAFGTRRGLHHNRRGLAVCTAIIRKANITDSTEVLTGLTRAVAQAGSSAPLDVALLQEAPTWRSDSAGIRAQWMERLRQNRRWTFGPSTTHASVWEAIGPIVRQHCGRGAFRRRPLVGGDSNHQVPPEIEDVIGPWAPGALRRRQAVRSRFAEASKTDSVVQFATTTGGTTWNTCPDIYNGDKPGPITTWCSSDGATIAQVDYILGTPRCAGVGGSRSQPVAVTILSFGRRSARQAIPGSRKWPSRRRSRGGHRLRRRR